MTQHGTLGAKPGLVRVLHMPIGKIHPSPENNSIYGAVNLECPDLVALAESIARHGVLEPLVITEDDYIVSGHRRYAAACLAGLEEVPVHLITCKRSDPEFVQLLASYNRQRNKTAEERAREEVIAAADPEEAYKELLAYRRARSRPADLGTQNVVLGEWRMRCVISKAKQPMLKAVQGVIAARADFWPLSDRSIHYAVLNDPPLRHASKPGSRYVNDLASYKDLCDLLTRARLTGAVPMDAIDDETRAEVLVRAFAETGAFVRHETNWFLRGYSRNLQRSQPAHVEVLAEKLTVRSIVESVCANYCLPLTVGRGYASLPPRYKMAQRFKKSGKDQLTLVVVSDADPEGESIGESFARSMRDDFDIEGINCVKAALTPDQARRMGLPTVMVAKAKSSRRKGFVEKYGEQVWELEALPPEQLQQVLRSTIEGVIDRDAFRAEVEAEKKDAAALKELRTGMLSYLARMNTEVRNNGPQS